MALGNGAPTSTTSSNIILGADDLYIALGNANTTDAYITFDGTNLKFFDSTVGTTKTLTQLAAAGTVTSLDTAFDGGKVINGATTEANACSIGGATDYLSIWQEGANDVRIDTSSGANLNLDANGGYINVYSDSTKLGFGAAGGATDAYIFFDGTNLRFYDSTYGAEVTLSSLANNTLSSPTVSGDMTFSDGKIVQTDTDDEIAYSVTSSSTTYDVIKATGNSTSSGSVIAALATDATLAGGGFYYRAYGGAANVFTVGRYGATIIAGTASTDVLTLAAGDLQITAGDIDIDLGRITIDNTADEGNTIKRNNATGTAAVLEVEQTHATGGVALTVDQNATGDVNAIEVENAGTGYAVTTTAAAAGGEGYEYIAAASGTGVGFRGDGTTGSWIGANDVGFIDIDTDGALAAGANLLRIDSTGTNAQNSFVAEILSSGNIAGATDGMCLNIVESGAAAATSYAVRIASTSNEALHVDTGLSLFDERVTITLADNTGPALAITNPDVTGNTNAVTIAPSGSGAGLAISPAEVDTKAILVTTLASATTSLVDLDLTTGAGWIGADGEGAIRLTSDGTNAHANASLVNIIKTGATVAAMDGSCLRIDDASTGGATAGYAVSINASGALEALHVDAGTVVVDETVAATGGIITVYSENDVTDPPTQAEMDTAFGAGAEALNGMLGVINDANGGANVWLCVCADGAWYYAAKLTIGA